MGEVKIKRKDIFLDWTVEEIVEDNIKRFDKVLEDKSKEKRK